METGPSSEIATTRTARPTGGEQSLVAGRRYIAVKQCPSFQAPMIFYSWEDAQNIIGHSNHGKDTAVYREFSSLQDAATFLENRPCPLSTVKNNVSPKSLSTRKRTSSTEKRLKQSITESRLSRKRSRIVAAEEDLESDVATLLNQWDDMLRLLHEYRAEMGHCNIQDPSATSTAHKYRGLYAFVERLRLYRKLWTEMQKIRQPNEESQSLQHLSSLLTSQRMEQLNALGFLWTTTNDADNDPKRFCPTNDEHLFNAMLTEMKRVTKEGNAPLNKYPKLQEWVRKMRNEYKAMKDKKPTTLTPDRLAKLVEAGVTFEVPGKKSWDQRAVEWLEYKTKNGGKDPKRYDKSGLGKWVYNQRAKYRENREGGKTNLTEEQIRRLNDWGFNWDFKLKISQQRAKSSPWEQRFQELCQFQNENGHCKVPQKYPVLGQWVHTQRNNYRALVHGKKSALTQERIQKLKSIGFDFGRERQTIARKATEALVEGEEVNEEYDDYDDYSNGADEAEEDNSHDLLLHGSLPVPLNQQFYHLHQVLAPHRQNSEV